MNRCSDACSACAAGVSSPGRVIRFDLGGPGRFASRDFALGPDDLIYVAVRVTDGGPFERFASVLSDEEQSRAAAFAFARDRDAYIAAHVLARLVLAGLSNRAPAELRFVNRSGGKPVPVDLEFGFNLSHTRGSVAVAAGFGEIGVDIETAPDFAINQVAAHALTPDEIRMLRDAPCPRAFFLKWWVSKEAVAKAWGVGMAAPFNRMQGQMAPDGWTTYRDGGRLGHAFAWGTGDLQMAVARAGNAPKRLVRLDFGLWQDPFTKDGDPLLVGDLMQCPPHSRETRR